MTKWILRIWHGLHGHPRDALMWSESQVECTRCGAMMHHADFYPFM